MAFFKDNKAALDAYLTQWLKTAGGNISYEYSLLTNRIKFTCKKCEATQTCDRPEGPNKFDYVVQEFVNLHAHRPGHERLEKEIAIQKGKILIAQAGVPNSGTWIAPNGGSLGGAPNNIIPFPVQQPFISPPPPPPPEPPKPQALKHKTGRRFR